MILNVLLKPFLLLYRLEKRIFKSIIGLFSSPKKTNDIVNSDAVLAISINKDNTTDNNNKRYKYVVRDPSSKIKTAYFDALSKNEVHSFLTSQGYQVISIEEDKFQTALGFASLGNRKMSSKNLTLFLTQLSTYIKAGIPLVEGVSILGRQLSKRNSKKVCERLVYELNSGLNFSNALEKQGNVFPKLLINMVKTAELTGQLSDTLDDMADYYRVMETNRKQIITALTYPSVIFVLSIAVITFMILYVVPQFVGIYSESGAKLPAITKFVVNLSTFLKGNMITVVVVIILCIIMLILSYKYVYIFRYSVQWILMHIPIVKTIIIHKEIVMFTKTFASLINHDVFITDSMEILGKITNNELYKTLINNSINNLASGKGISAAFKNKWAFPIPAYEMLVTGERTGRMGDMMETISKHYQEEQKNLIEQLKSLIEPVMIIFLAISVGFIILSIIIPMFDMYSQIG